MSCIVPISAVFPACTRIAEALKTIKAIRACDPLPEEIIVHVDGGSREVIDAIRSTYPDVRIITSEHLIGPGGARNKLVHAAVHDLVANFDDDSCPDHPDYFARVMQGFNRFPNMAVLSAASMQCEKDMPGYMRIGIFSGCGCVFSKKWFLKTSGLVPLQIAYCMEETDLSLRLHALGGLIIHDPRLRVHHFHEPSKVPVAATNAAILANTALMPFLRYPLVLFPLGVWHVASRIWSVVRRGWWTGLGRGLLMIPLYFVRYASIRSPVPAQSIFEWFNLRQTPQLLSAPTSPAVP